MDWFLQLILTLDMSIRLSVVLLLACLAGVLVMDPRLLLLDEPSAALDLRNRRRLIDLLRRGDSEANVMLMPGDVIIIPESMF